MLKVLALLVATRLLLLLVHRNWLTGVTKIILGLILLQLLGKMIRVLSYS